jgi:hypothetical protein
LIDRVQSKFRFFLRAYLLFFQRRGEGDHLRRGLIFDHGEWVHDPRTDMNSALSTPSRFVNLLRALFEPIPVQHFGDVMDEFLMTA